MSHRPPVVEQYGRFAEDYDARWSFYVEATVRETLRRLQMPPEAHVLDIGCGTGALLSALGSASPHARLAGVDPTAEMLAVARRRLPGAELREAWAENLPFPDASFDAVISASTFHYIRAPQAALAEMKRVLRPGGRLLITDWCDDYLACRVCGLYLRLFDKAHFRIYRQQECRDLLVQAGFAAIAVETYRISWLWGLMSAQGIAPTDAAPAVSR